MYAIPVRSATEARENFSAYLDDVARKSPQAIRRQRDSFITMSFEHINALLPDLFLTLTYDIEDDGTYSGTIEEIGLCGNADTLSNLASDLAEQLMEYAQDYFTDFNKYFFSPNRRSHFPYVVKALAQSDIDAVIALYKYA
ncbi:MAG: hypothetical protein DDT20_01101 [Firmicutes bacterium]|nr:hypothetical protein [Bacillota bacterium]